MAWEVKNSINSNLDLLRVSLVIPSLQAGGMERVMAELAGYFAEKEDTEVHLVLYDLSREIFYQVPENVIIHTPSFNFNNRFRLFYTYKTLLFLRRTIRKIKPATILSFGEYWNSFLLLAVLGLRYPVFVSDRSQPDKSLGRFHDKLRHWLYPTATGLIFQTERAKNIFLQNTLHDNTIVIGNPVRQISTARTVNKREKIVLMVGRLIKSKHQDKLIEIFAGINLPDWRLMLVGYDHLKQNNMERLRMLAEHLGVGDRVIFTGKVENIEELYLNSSVFAFTSSSEGFPNVIGEAMSAGLPVVAFDCIAGPSEMITDNHDGFLIPLHDYAGFSTKLTMLMTTPGLRAKFGANGRESIRRFASDKVSEAFYSFITKEKTSQA